MAAVLMRVRGGTKEIEGVISGENIRGGAETSSGYFGDKGYGEEFSVEGEGLCLTGELFSPLLGSAFGLTNTASNEYEATQEEGVSWSSTNLSMGTEMGGLFALREKEINWMRSHLEEIEKYKGQWVAVEGETVVAGGLGFSEVVLKAKSKGIEVPYIVKIEEAANPFIG